MIFRGIRKVHMCGIGGAGMSGIAEVLASLNFAVTGSDAAESATVARLRTLGIPVTVGHDPALVTGADVLVYSSAIRDDNPELRRARELRVPVIRRAEMLAELMRLKQAGVAVAGSHGKTTVTSLVAHICQMAGLDPTVIIGGRLDALGGGARVGKGNLLIAEADESDGSFLRLSPVIGVVTNIDREHLDHYDTYEMMGWDYALLARSIARPEFKDKATAVLKKAFIEFLSRLPFYGRGVVCVDDPGVRDIIDRVERPLLTYGIDSPADLSAAGITAAESGTAFTLLVRGAAVTELSVPLLGTHNVRNTLAAVGVAMDLGIDSALVREALPSFRNAARRFETIHRGATIEIIDDYGHHPTEIIAVLACARARRKGRIVVVFQPHRYTRTAILMDDFAQSFGDADEVIITDIYPAGEQVIEGVSAKGIVQRLAAKGKPHVTYAPTLADAARALGELARGGDTIITLGAGDIRKVAELFLARWGDK